MNEIFDPVVDMTVTDGQLARQMPLIVGYIKKHNLEFGGGQLSQDEHFYLLPRLAQTYILEWANGCAVPTKSVLTNTADWMLDRVGETNFMFGYLLREAHDLQPELCNKLRGKKKRLETEPRPPNVRSHEHLDVTTHEKHGSPEDNKEYIYPMQHIVGYAAPRVLIEIEGRRPEREGMPHRERMMEAFYALDDILQNKEKKQINDPFVFLALLANEAFKKYRVNPVAILGHVLTVGILEEHGCKKDYQNVLAALKDYAPELWKFYLQLDPDIKRKNGIAKPEDFL